MEIQIGSRVYALRFGGWRLQEGKRRVAGTNASVHDPSDLPKQAHSQASAKNGLT